jgi:hypothetical protein
MEAQGFEYYGIGRGRSIRRPQKEGTQALGHN